MYTLPRCLITGGGGGAKIDLGPRSMYALPRCLITATVGGGGEIDVHPATVPDYWGAEIDVHPATVPDY